MFKKLLFFIPVSLYIGAMQVQAMTAELPAMTITNELPVHSKLLAEQEMSLPDRYPVPVVSDVFKDNILLTLAYMSGKVQNPSQINWDDLRKSTTYEFVLNPGEAFAFHDGIMSQYSLKTVLTTKAHYNSAEGFRSSGYLYGDGVCHFASLINWVANDAGLHVIAPVNHDFAQIPGIASEYGTSIYYSPGEQSVNEQQNLYIENTFDTPVRFVFDYSNDVIKVSVFKL